MTLNQKQKNMLITNHQQCLRMSDRYVYIVNVVSILEAMSNKLK